MSIHLFRRKVTKVVPRLLWRMSSTDPAGVYVFASAEPPSPEQVVELHERGFRASSLELATGAEVRETAMDTLSGDLIDEFSKTLR